ncbi:hypothetical protein F4778DRAFT_716107 [Xylariomycetidae sp. FL2044]|nr:hypothetical protein F4778DRAFT_716107 [Xylariomycetidae sp. FL2044]
MKDAVARELGFCHPTYVCVYISYLINVLSSISNLASCIMQHHIYVLIWVWIGLSLYCKLASMPEISSDEVSIWEGYS